MVGRHQAPDSRGKIKKVEVTLFEEFTIKNPYEMAKLEEEFLKYLLDLHDLRAKAPNREYCFNILTS